MNDFSLDEIGSIFSRASLFKKSFLENSRFDDLIVKSHTGPNIMGLIFLEPSTRTRISFQMAGRRMGIGSVRLDGSSSNSRVKGESDVDTIETVAAMMPDFLVVRYGGDVEVQACLEGLSCPVINAGSGAAGHPTQALLDVYTILQKRGKIEDEKILFVGDVLHSRVANSNLTLLKSMGAKIGIFCPEHLLPKSQEWSGAKVFSSLSEGMKWSSVTMALRIQMERHNEGEHSMPLDHYVKQYRVDSEAMTNLSEDGILMNPGPFVHDVELTSEVLEDPRCCVREQVTNGMFVRASLISHINGFSIVGE